MRVVMPVRIPGPAGASLQRPSVGTILLESRAVDPPDVSRTRRKISPVGERHEPGPRQRQFDLPGFIVLPEVSYPQGGSANWSNGYLPASYQGTPLRAKGSPILDLAPPAGVSRQRQHKNLELINRLNIAHAADGGRVGGSRGFDRFRRRGSVRRLFVPSPGPASPAYGCPISSR